MRLPNVFTALADIAVGTLALQRLAAIYYSRSQYEETLKVATRLSRSPDPKWAVAGYSLIGTVPDLVAKQRRVRDRWAINSVLVGWLDEPDLAAFAPVVEQLAGT